MKIRITVLALLAVTAGVFAYTRPHNPIPSDLRDALSGGSGSAMDDLKGSHGGGADVPLPVAPESGTVSKRVLLAPGTIRYGQQVTRQCFAVGVSLDPATYREETAAKTRTNVERELSGRGLKLLRYLDEYAISSLEFSAAREVGMLGFPSNSSKIEALLKDIPEVKRLKESGRTDNKLFWTVYLKEGFYPPRIERAFSWLNIPHTIKYNNVHDTITIEIEAGSADPASALHILKTLPGIKMENGLKIANMSVVTFYANGSDSETIGWAGCASGNCRVFEPHK